MSIQPFTIAIPQAKLDDLNERLQELLEEQGGLENAFLALVGEGGTP